MKKRAKRNNYIKNKNNRRNLHVRDRAPAGTAHGRRGIKREETGKKKGFIPKEPIGDGTDSMDIPRCIDLPMEFPGKARRQAENCPTEVGGADLEGREDLRIWQIVTIDGPDAKDLDDAVSLTETEEGYELGVHIADVSYYVSEGSPLDKEAYRRGTSVYIPGTVIPMLPVELSNGICSLQAGKDRLCVSVIMELDRSGKTLSSRITRTVIRVGERMSYPDVKAIIDDHDEALCSRYAGYVDLFERMHRVACLIRARRKKRGAIDFDFPESRLVFDETGYPVDAVREESDCAKQLIEDFMLTANETVAAAFRKKDLPFVYRVHEDPDADKVEQLIAFIRKKGGEIEKHKQKITPREMQQAVEQLKGKPGEALLSREILRTMQQAHYEVSPRGHFGLAAKDYCHFTSPIRRYPDLQIHRIICEQLEGKLDKERISHYKQILPKAASQSSVTERRAVEVERETEKFEKCRLMLRHIGEEFEGEISGVTAWGLYVMLPNTVEGLVPVAEMCDDYYLYDEEEQVLRGRLTHRVYAMGDRVRVRLLEADPARRTLDFELV